MLLIHWDVPRFVATFFLTLSASVIAVTFGMTSSTMYYYTKVMSELFLDSSFPDTKNTFRGMTTMHDFWRVRRSRACLRLAAHRMH
jgi:hypothetical protein